MPPAASPYQCLSCRLAQLKIAKPRRRFHVSTPRQKSPFPSVTAKDMGMIKETNTHVGPVQVKPYDEKEKDLLSKKYNKRQMEIIEVGEEAIPAEDLLKQGLQRTDASRIAYYDDFSTERPIIDYPAMDPGGLSGEDILAARNVIRTEKLSTTSARDDERPAMRRLMQQTGLTAKEISALKTKPLVRHSVVNQTRMGKIRSQYYLTIAGNGDGMLGIGEGKSAEDADAEQQARYAAIRNMKPIPRYEDRTIYGEVEGKVAATVVQIQSRPPGFGNRCQHLIFEMARAAGIQDVAARTPRSRNKMNVVKAAYAALLSQRLPEDIAKARGRKMIDVRKVYYGGSVP